MDRLLFLRFPIALLEWLAAAEAAKSRAGRISRWGGRIAVIMASAPRKAIDSMRKAAEKPRAVPFPNSEIYAAGTPKDVSPETNKRARRPIWFSADSQKTAL